MRFTCLDVAKAALGEPKKQSGDELFYCCPVHPDHDPSLLVNNKKDVWACFPCGAQGTAWQLASFLSGHAPENKQDIIAWLREHGLMEENSDNLELEATYVYEDEQRNPLFRVERYRTPKGKTFRQSRPDGNGGWIPGVKGVRLVPYRLPDFIDEQTIYIVEGEGIADALLEWGIPTTTNPMGAGKWKAEYNTHFQDKQVVILPDHDAAGESQAQNVARYLFPVAKSIKVIHLPGFPKKGDFKDWRQAGGTQKQFSEIVGNTLPLTREEVQKFADADDSHKKEKKSLGESPICTGFFGWF